MSLNCKIVLGVLTALAAACGKVPELEKSGNFIPEEKIVSIAYLKSLYTGRTMVIEDDIYIRGSIVSADIWGSFYHTVVLEDETGGIALKVDMDNYSRDKMFSWGRVLTVRCSNLTLGDYGGMIYMGIEDGGIYPQVVDIPEYMLPLIMACDSVGSVPMTWISLPEISSRYICCSLLIPDVQFVDPSLTWCDPDEDTDRILEDREGNTIIVRTSKKFSGANHQLPRGSGTFGGILTYFNGNYQMVTVTGGGMTEPRF